MAATEEFDVPVPFIEDPDDQGTNRTYLGTPLFQVETTNFTSTVTEQYVLHGKLSREGKEPASLVVVHFSLHSDSSVKSRRFRKVTISLTFTSASGQAADDPAIRCFAPAQDGNIGVIPTAVTRQTQHQAGASAKVDAAPIPASLGFSYDWQSQAAWKEHVMATISAKNEASTRTRDRDGFNVVQWTITENGKQKQIPDSYQLAVVIERKSADEPFMVQAKVHASVDALHAMANASDLKSLIGLRWPVKTYEPAKKAGSGKLEYPEDAKVDGEELGLLVKGRELDKFAYVHVIELVAPLSIYGGKQVFENNDRDNMSLNTADNDTDGSGTKLNVSLQFGGGNGKDDEDGDDDDDDDFQDASESL
ncbi:hypothetical protein B0H66DRAFT_563829 [Apodospora peruviana]|uniref:Uncharacterized protein n=1 Tax=Apodospora peruviana TaxID=516989 RepID=A0AAE0HYI3_9PEZI|nr:hypothetical protein B0H66DRAFT_563829 [Apodospora peruviana]